MRALVALAVFSLSACDAPSDAPVAKSSAATVGGQPPANAAQPENNVIDVESDDAVMNKAIADARASVDHFVTELNKAEPDTTYSIKATFTQGTKTEHMWLIDLSYEGTAFTGTLNNEPRDVTHVKLGDKATVDRSEISDWLITAPDGKLHGGYTIRALLPTMPANERETFETMLAPLPK